MKYYYSFTILLLLATLSFKQMNMAKVSSKLYMDKYEVTNKDWKTFENYLIEKGENPEKYRDDKVWTTKYKNKLSRRAYYGHVAYDDYPVVGVTHEGAKKYCVWKGTQSKIEGTFRLPTIEELRYQITVGEEGKRWKKWQKRARKSNERLYNFYKYPWTITAPSQAHPGNKFGIYNIKGNAAEMTMTKGKALGGSYADLDNKDWTTHIQTYDAPANWLGFRCVCEL